jgi:hypothetical protein
MLKVELAVQELGKLDGIEGQTAWPLCIDEQQLLQLLEVPGVFVANTRKKDQIESFAVWSVKSVVLLVTVLASWQRKQKWCRPIMEILRKEDAKMQREWHLRTCYYNETVMPDYQVEPILLTEAPKLDHVLIRGTVPDKAAHRAALKEEINAARAHAELNSIGLDLEIEITDSLGDTKRLSPFDYHQDEIDFLVSNLGTEYPLS